MNYKKLNLKDVGSKIKQIRVSETNFTQEQLASKCGLTSKAISDIELGKSIPTIINLAKICSALNTRVENIIY